MKYLIIFLSFIFFSAAAPAQENDKDIKTEKLLVSGNCGMCEKRIEKAAYVKGVKQADWDKKTKMLTVTYKPSKTSKEEILKSVAEAGYDSEGFTANEKSYKKLPECCRYRTGSCEH